MSLLSARAVTKRFGGLVAIDALDLDVEQGSITALIGPNGAGKTTFFNCVTGLLTPDGGEVALDGADLLSMQAHERAHAGLGRTFQRLEVFSGMSVRDNLRVAAECARRGGLWRDLLRLRRSRTSAADEAVDHVLSQVGLHDVADVGAGDLPTGTLRLVELARALCTEPKVLLLDEPASGLDSAETERLAAVLGDVRDAGVSILLVEHDVDLVMEVSDFVYVLDFGRRIAAGTPEQVQADAAVQAAYLGVEEVTDAAAAGA